MDVNYIYLIVAAALIAIIAVYAVANFKKLKMGIKLPGGEIDLEGDQSTEPQREDAPSAKTKIGGDLTGSTVTTSVTSETAGKAETGVGGNVKDSDILTENKKP
jgi:hypothetical protein